MHSQEIRHRCVIHHQHFLRSVRRVAKIYKVSKSSVARWVAKAAAPPSKPSQRKKRISVVGAVKDSVAAFLKENPFSTMEDVVRSMKKDGIEISTTTARRACRAAMYSRKRVRPRFSPKKATAEQAKEFLATWDGAEELVSVDETCVYLQESPRYGYSLKGERCYHRRRCPRRTGKVTLLLAISQTRGVIGHTVVKGSINSKSFSAFVDDLKAPQGSALIVDNASFHRSAIVKEAAREKGYALLYTPPYTPEFNPVENAFSVLKAYLRRPSSGSGEPNDLRRGLETVTVAKCQAFFRESRRQAVLVRDA